MTVNNVVLHYLEWEGREEPPVLLLRGATGHAHLWDAFVPALTGSYRIIALDQRGHGESEWATPPRGRRAGIELPHRAGPTCLSEASRAHGRLRHQALARAPGKPLTVAF